MAKSKWLPRSMLEKFHREGFLKPMGLMPNAVARAFGGPRTRIERLAREETPVTADTALRLAERAFAGQSWRSWNPWEYGVVPELRQIALKDRSHSCSPSKKRIAT